MNGMVKGVQRGHEGPRTQEEQGVVLTKAGRCVRNKEKGSVVDRQLAGDTRRNRRATICGGARVVCREGGGGSGDAGSVLLTEGNRTTQQVGVVWQKQGSRVHHSEGVRERSRAGEKEGTCEVVLCVVGGGRDGGGGEGGGGGAW